MVHIVTIADDPGDALFSTADPVRAGGRRLRRTGTAGGVQPRGALGGPRLRSGIL
jgi:hypothetical protein